jgi:hypothetical protein
MHIHVNTPTTNHGEQRVLERLIGLGDDKLHIWFGLNYLPGVRDIDVLLWHEKAGVFAVEVKGVQLDDVLEYGYNHCLIDGRKPDQGPVVQAHRAMESLKHGFLVERGIKSIFIVPTACWPLVYREEWNDRWDSGLVTGPYAESMIFREDLELGAEHLLHRLAHIWANPPIRAAARDREVTSEPVRSRSTFRHDTERLEALKAVLNNISKPKLTITDRERLKTIEAGVSGELAKQFDPDKPVKAIFTGAPGTGKTFRLLQIASTHAYRGHKVLFACFNKTLAADLRRLVLASPRLRQCEYTPDVVDVFELAKQLFTANGLEHSDSLDQEEWGEYVTQELESQQEQGVEHYDTLLIDEAQDMAGWNLRLLEMHAGPKTTIVAARGNGQELYRSASDSNEWFERLQLAGAEVINLRQNFRNTFKNFIVAKAFHECYPDEEKAAQSIARTAKQKRRKTQDELQFSRPGARITAVEPMVSEEGEGVDDNDYEQRMIQRYLQVIRSEYEQLMKDENATPMELLVLVPTPNGAIAQYARNALDELRRQNEIEFIDLTKEELRRVSPPGHKVRLCTFHSARGLEGTRVVIFGFEQLDKLADSLDVDPRKLAFVVLTRAVFETVVAYPQRLSTTVRSLKVLQAIRNAYHRLGVLE